jgi:hypothetical protein
MSKGGCSSHHQHSLGRTIRGGRSVKSRDEQGSSVFHYGLDTQLPRAVGSERWWIDEAPGRRSLDSGSRSGAAISGYGVAR